MGDRCTPREVEDAAVSGALAAGESAIILLHAWPASVPAALPAIIRRLREAGSEFVTLDDFHPAALSASVRGSQEQARTAE
jgi:peptidoglycan/xylan/chitin deacetylase (PgdA/CDA1 family)